MIDPATSWFEVSEIKTKSADVIVNVVEQTWLTRYPRPEVLIFDHRTKFMAEFAEMCKNDYGINLKPMTVRNPQGNSIVERVHQMLGNIVRTFSVEDLDAEDPWSGILAAARFAIHSTYHTTLQATPMQLVFGCDALLNIRHEANWNFICERKQKSIRINNKRENEKRIPYTFMVNQKVLLKTDWTGPKFGREPFEGPYKIVSIHNDNGTVRLKKGSVINSYNIRNIKPYRK